MTPLRGDEITRRTLLGLAARASGVLAAGANGAAAKPRKKKHRCPSCRRCGKACCPADRQCGGGSCVVPCASGGCGAFPAACSLFPVDNVWRARVDGLRPDANSDAYVASVGASGGLHPDFGAGVFDGGPIGIPFITIDGGVTPAAITFAYADESDPGPYPIPPDAPIEGGACSRGDRHLLVVDASDCTLYEVYAAQSRRDGSWRAGSGAIFDLRSNALRPRGWTSADAAGLPILPGLVRYEEVAAGEILHALRFTAPRTRDDFIWPARHAASSSGDPNLPPLGQRFRLKSTVDLSGFSASNRVILTALQRYGMFLADNGSAWFLSGVPDDRWDNDDLHALQTGIHGGDFEAVDESSLQMDPDSGQVR